MIPFVQRMDGGRAGVAGAIPSWPVILRGALGSIGLPGMAAPLGGCLALAFYALNPGPALYAVDGDDGAAVSARDDLVSRC